MGRRVLPWLRHALRDAPGFLFVALFIVAWQVASTRGYLSEFQFPPPSKLASTTVDLVRVGFPQGTTVGGHLWATASRILWGFLLGAAAAIPLGLLIGRQFLVREALSPVIVFAQSVAVISLLPLAVALFGPDELSRILLVTWAVFWVVLVNTMEGVRQVDPVLIRAGRALGANRRQLLARVMLPATTPRIFAGLKIALGLSFTVIIAVELIGTVDGLGALISQARRVFRGDIVLSGMILIAVVGFLLAKALDWLERVLLPWVDNLETFER